MFWLQPVFHAPDIFTFKKMKMDSGQSNFNKIPTL